VRNAQKRAVRDREREQRERRRKRNPERLPEVDSRVGFDPYESRCLESLRDRPKLLRDLKRSGKLRQLLRERAQNAVRVVDHLVVERGLSVLEAQERVLPELLDYPSEELVPELGALSDPSLKQLPPRSFL